MQDLDNRIKYASDPSTHYASRGPQRVMKEEPEGGGEEREALRARSFSYICIYVHTLYHHAIVYYCVRTRPAEKIIIAITAPPRATFTSRDPHGFEKLVLHKEVSSSLCPSSTAITLSFYIHYRNPFPLPVPFLPVSVRCTATQSGAAEQEPSPPSRVIKGRDNVLMCVCGVL